MTYSIEFSNVSKRYRIGSNLSSLRDLLGARKEAKNAKYHWAVKDVDFALKPGESLGIIGPNGAGKTTILKLLSRVTQPTDGYIKVNGRYSALIELGAGFHPDLTGRENVFLNGTILGMSRKEIKKRYDQIVEFSGIAPFIDTPVKRYSSGMYARLGFAIAAHIDPEVLIVDEVLAVGDYAFQMKCYNRMDELRANGTSLIFVSHNMEVVRRVCDRGMVMYRGQNIFQGAAAEAVIAYSDALRQAARESNSTAPKEDGMSQRAMTFDAEVKTVTLLNEGGKAVTVLDSGTKATLAVDYQFNKDVKNPIFAFTIRTEDGRIVYDNTTQWMKIKTPDFYSGQHCRVEYTFDVALLEGSYELGVDVAAGDLSTYYDRLERALGFWVKSSGGAKGLANLEAKVAFKELASNGVTV
ncbi:MAG: ABC transporter ATP-binding protein [Anaerolineae bacterium]|nr:ABC transporter ATP-binding protein [Anaerolineae bacterium]